MKQKYCEICKEYGHKSTAGFTVFKGKKIRAVKCEKVQTVANSISKELLEDEK